MSDNLNNVFLVNLALALSPYGCDGWYSSAKNLEDELKKRGVDIKLYREYKLPDNIVPAAYMIRRALQDMYAIPVRDDEWLYKALKKLGYEDQKIEEMKQAVLEKISGQSDFYKRQIADDYEKLLKLNPELPRTNDIVHMGCVLDGAMFGFNVEEIEYFITDYKGNEGEYKELRDKLTGLGIQTGYVLAPETAKKIISALERRNHDVMMQNCERRV